MIRRPVYAATHVEAPFDEVAARLRGDPADWLPRPAVRDEHGAWLVRLRAGRLAPAGVDAIVEVGPADGPRLPDLLVRSLGWRAARADAAFPRLSADLELQRVTAFAQSLTIVGTYTPPLSVVGAAADSLVGRHVADAVVRAFLADVAAGLDHRAPTLRA